MPFEALKNCGSSFISSSSDYLNLTVWFSLGGVSHSFCLAIVSVINDGSIRETFMEEIIYSVNANFMQKNSTSLAAGNGVFIPDSYGSFKIICFY